MAEMKGLGTLSIFEMDSEQKAAKEHFNMISLIICLKRMEVRFS